MKKKVIILLSSLFSLSVNANIIACEKGMVEQGDSYETVVKKCGEGNSSKGGGVKNYKNKISNKLVVFSFRKFKKHLPDGKHINFIFIEDQLMFVTD